MPDLITPVIWGDVCWLVEPITQALHDTAMREAARQLGFADADALAEAQLAGNLAADGDVLAALAMRYIRRETTRVAQSRSAASAPRRGKWDWVKPEALDHIERIRQSRPDLSASSLAVLVLDRLGQEHQELPDKRTVQRWLNKT